MVFWFYAKEYGVRGEVGFVMLFFFGWGVGVWIISIFEWGLIFLFGGFLVLDRVRVKLFIVLESRGLLIKVIGS